MDKLIFALILIATGYFVYRYVRNAVRGTGGCHGDCANCSLKLKTKHHNQAVSATKSRLEDTEC